MGGFNHDRMKRSIQEVETYESFIKRHSILVLTLNIEG